MTSPFIIERVSDTQLLGMSAVLQVQDILSCRSWETAADAAARAIQNDFDAASFTVGRRNERGHFVMSACYENGIWWGDEVGKRIPRTSLTHSVASARKPMLREVKRPTDWFLHRYYIGVPLISSFGDGKIAGSFIVGLPDKRHFNDAAVQMPDRVRAPARNAGGPRHAGALLQTAVRGEGYADASSLAAI